MVSFKRLHIFKDASMTSSVWAQDDNMVHIMFCSWKIIWKWCRFRFWRNKTALRD